MNRSNEIEIQTVVEKVVGSECNSIYTEEIERKIKIRLDKQKKS